MNKVSYSRFLEQCMYLGISESSDVLSEAYDIYLNIPDEYFVNESNQDNYIAALEFFAENGIQLTKDQMDNLNEGLTDILGKATNNLSSLASKYGDKSKANMQDAKTTSSQSEFLNNAGKSITNNYLSKGLNLASKGVSKLSSGVSNIQNSKAGQVAGQVGNTLKTGATNFAGNAANVVKSYNAKNGNAPTSTGGTGVLNTLKSGAKQFGQFAQGKAGDVGSSALNKLKGFGKMFTSSPTNEMAEIYKENALEFFIRNNVALTHEQVEALDEVGAALAAAPMIAKGVGIATKAAPMIAKAGKIAGAINTGAQTVKSVADAATSTANAVGAAKNAVTPVQQPQQ